MIDTEVILGSELMKEAYVLTKDNDGNVIAEEEYGRKFGNIEFANDDPMCIIDVYQNGQKLMFKCELCNVEASSAKSLKDHFEGSVHSRALQERGPGSKNNNAKNQRKRVSEEDAGGSGVSSGDGDGGGGGGVKVPKKDPTPPGVGVEKESVLSGILSTHNEPLIGLQYLDEYQNVQTTNDPDYWCRLCDKTFNMKSVISHVTGVTHRMKYLQEHYPGYHHEVDSKGAGHFMCKQYAEQIDQDEGRHPLNVLVNDGPTPVTARTKMNHQKNTGMSVRPPGGMGFGPPGTGRSPGQQGGPMNDMYDEGDEMNKDGNGQTGGRNQSNNQMGPNQFGNNQMGQMNRMNGPNQFGNRMGGPNQFGNNNNMGGPNNQFRGRGPMNNRMRGPSGQMNNMSGNMNRMGQKGQNRGGPRNMRPQQGQHNQQNQMSPPGVTDEYDYYEEEGPPGINAPSSMPSGNQNQGGGGMQGPNNQMGTGINQNPMGNHVQMGGPPGQMCGPPGPMGGAPGLMGGPPRPMGGPPVPMGGPSYPMVGPQGPITGPPRPMVPQGQMQQGWNPMVPPPQLMAPMTGPNPSVAPPITQSVTNPMPQQMTGGPMMDPITMWNTYDWTVYGYGINSYNTWYSHYYGGVPTVTPPVATTHTPTYNSAAYIVKAPIVSSGTTTSTTSTTPAVDVKPSAQMAALLGIKPLNTSEVSSKPVAAKQPIATSKKKVIKTETNTTTSSKSSDTNSESETTITAAESKSSEFTSKGPSPIPTAAVAPQPKPEVWTTTKIMKEILKNADRLIMNEDDASLALQASNVLTQALLTYRLKHVPKEILKSNDMSKLLQVKRRIDKK